MQGHMGRTRVVQEAERVNGMRVGGFNVLFFFFLKEEMDETA